MHTYIVNWLGNCGDARAPSKTWGPLIRWPTDTMPHLWDFSLVGGAAFYEWLARYLSLLHLAVGQRWTVPRISQTSMISLQMRLSMCESYLVYIKYNYSDPIIPFSFTWQYTNDTTLSGVSLECYPIRITQGSRIAAIPKKHYPGVK